MEELLAVVDRKRRANLRAFHAFYALFLVYCRYSIALLSYCVYRAKIDDRARVVLRAAVSVYCDVHYASLRCL